MANPGIKLSRFTGNIFFEHSANGPELVCWTSSKTSALNGRDRETNVRPRSLGQSATNENVSFASGDRQFRPVDSDIRIAKLLSDRPPDGISIPAQATPENEHGGGQEATFPTIPSLFEGMTGYPAFRFSNRLASVLYRPAWTTLPARPYVADRHSRRRSNIFVMPITVSAAPSITNPSSDSMVAIRSRINCLLSGSK